eukprot:gnl/TRDRNA2_/TRDRNA2_190990_c0_seq1.p1 gnl/TRDRNA2_/TRDRNA2_190990_c0~~gnl/TRDRNA2_/TRDRNA2_190990_c0_seq1.p1  ORF type:complete len:730 (+),score=132.67 gnl/TRDRNA2_/TRDRNA2_190990_c0_seq1:56-2245(+)
MPVQLAGHKLSASHTGQPGEIPVANPGAEVLAAVERSVVRAAAPTRGYAQPKIGQLVSVSEPKLMPLPDGFKSLPKNPRTASPMMRSLSAIGKEIRPSAEEVYVNQRNSYQSFTERSIEVVSEDGAEKICVVGHNSTTVRQIKEMLVNWLLVDESKLSFFNRTGKFRRQLRADEEVPSKVLVKGISSFKRRKRTYVAPQGICIVGAGVGALSTALALIRDGREQFFIVDRCSGFGGKSWVQLANKDVRLQTEFATYSLDGAAMTEESPVWPSRDEIMAGIMHTCTANGLLDRGMFKTEVQAVKEKQVGMNGNAVEWGYEISAMKENDVQGEPAQEFKLYVSAVLSFPGVLCIPNQVAFVGELSFGGYIEYAHQADFSEVDNKCVMVVGHGSFAIESLRQCLERNAKQIYIVSRSRKLTAPRVASWLTGQCEGAFPATVMMEVFEKAYELVEGTDVWSHECAQTVVNRKGVCTEATVSQSSWLAVSDFYFLACYYKKCEVVCDKIEKLQEGMVRLEKADVPLKCDVILKATGFSPDPSTDKMLGCKELYGIWAGYTGLNPACSSGVDCHRTFVTAGAGVEYTQFNSLAVLSHLTSFIDSILWFLNYPEDIQMLQGKLPRHKARSGEEDDTSAKDDRPAYAPNLLHYRETLNIIFEAVPALELVAQGRATSARDAMRTSYPVDAYLSHCEKEWARYNDLLGAGKKDRPAYPYTSTMLQGWIDSANKAASKK